MAKSDSYTQAGKAIVQADANSPGSLVKQHKDYLDQRVTMLGKWATGGLKPEALIRFIMVDMANNDKLRACSRESIYLGLIACAVTGLEPGSLKSEAWLVPFKQKATFIAGYRGYIKQARRSREIVGFTSNVIYEGDMFDLDLGTANSLVHKPGRERGENIVGAYAIARLANGHNEIEFMDRPDLDHIRKVAESRGASPAWSEWTDQMFRKAPIRRLAKRLPMGEDFYRTLALEEAHDDGRDQLDVLDIATDGEASRVAGAPTPNVATKEAPMTERGQAEKGQGALFGEGLTEADKRAIELAEREEGKR